MQVRPQIEVDLREFGVEGTITLMPMDFTRKTTLKNNIGKATHYAKKGDKIEVESQDLGDISIYTVMAYITDAPFDFKTLGGFMKFMAKLDRIEVGLADKLFNHLGEKIEEIKKGSASPFAQSEPQEIPKQE